ncbi:MAG: alpha-amylase C-terminal beta-sheet domain-containing protein [Candidatus Wallbacteria bacterium]|nr:alpha-amylase C-terminal beta-sheet domain-containing protein [Candidatus Wallbacteria bacterium]
MQNARSIYILVLLIFFFTSSVQSGNLDGNYSGVMLQGFHWYSWKSSPWWGVIEQNAGKIADGHFTMVWLPPCSTSAASEGYLPTRLSCLDTPYGTKDQLKSAVNKLHSYNLKALADIVINHRCGTKDWADFTDPQWGPDSVCCDDEWPGAQGGTDTGASYSAARDIDHNKEYVRKSIIDWLKLLRSDVGFDGWRYDFVRGYHGSFTDMYNQATTPYFSVGEWWGDLNINNPDVNRQMICNWLDAAGGNSAAFDFTTKGLLQHCVTTNEFYRLKDKDGKPAGLIGWWPAKAVTFVDNHDTGPSTGGSGGQNHWPFPGDKVLMGYAYILTHPGTPCVYWCHYFDWGTGIQAEIKKLIEIRQQAGITSTSDITIPIADNSKYVAQVGKNLIVKIGPGDWSPASGWTLAASGAGYAVWTK